MKAFADSQAPNAAAIKNARGVVIKKKLAGLFRSTDGTLIFGEYDVGDFHRVFQVQETIDASKIEAEFKNGVLIVHLPKHEREKPKQVPIRVNA